MNNSPGTSVEKGTTFGEGSESPIYICCPWCHRAVRVFDQTAGFLKGTTSMPRTPVLEPPPVHGEIEPEDEEEEEQDVPDADERFEIHPSNLFDLSVEFWRSHRPESDAWDIVTCLMHMIRSGEYIPAAVWSFPQTGMVEDAANDVFEGLKVGQAPTPEQLARAFPS
ncbi:hypothetical protein WJX72_008818 [[Myrmecia] bisecta]|uniref:Uncharacterized protein n=1 Tax=[Myrmecia] bisecta TaxID=41462 RepID=A0AAW1R8T0_9CHLO